MSGKYLLDTNIVIALFASDAAVVGRIGKVENIFVPSVVIGELFYGAEKSSKPKRNSERIERFVSDNVILNCNMRIARLYGKVKNNLREKGRPIPENDIWIVATAFWHDLILVSRDGHFEEVKDLKLERW
uniref:Ribonuclease VapC n=1 Tax=Candidatus Kentrum sp. LPFa TaxID=2126335 RepID=A0A450XIP9_9GAMM|nr:MAG: tRNA(fMet)-specific endonuclease VapC [Candidatus Kentron sp. LPFa]VFK16006.1 MAG: tRNA(fMet)-specific endonuclease VapC [Candidatus Kentron sp. LPFa]VFK29048.1 MAG: tRNA(fMet)-specific endonuclease VapC [Candidatus Kentron sp. LPFa]